MEVYFFSHPGMFNMTFPCTTTLGAIDPARCLIIKRNKIQTTWPSNMNCDCHYHGPHAIIIEIFNRLCSFPSPPNFKKPCDIWDTDRPFCYTRLKEACNAHQFSFFLKYLFIFHFLPIIKRKKLYAGWQLLWRWKCALGLLSG